VNALANKVTGVITGASENRVTAEASNIARRNRNIPESAAGRAGPIARELQEVMRRPTGNMKNRDSGLDVMRKRTLASGPIEASVIWAHMKAAEEAHNRDMDPGVGSEVVIRTSRIVKAATKEEATRNRASENSAAGQNLPTAFHTSRWNERRGGGASSRAHAGLGLLEIPRRG
jgi:hypothetical protein